MQKDDLNSGNFIQLKFIFWLIGTLDLLSKTYSDDRSGKTFTCNFSDSQQCWAWTSIMSGK